MAVLNLETQTRKMEVKCGKWCESDDETDSDIVLLRASMSNTLKLTEEVVRAVG